MSSSRNPIVKAPPHACVPPREKIEYLTAEQADGHADSVPVPFAFATAADRQYFRRVAVEDGIHGTPPYAVGSLWRCSCGRIWEVVPPVRGAAFVSFVNRWAPVGRLRSWWLRRTWDKRGIT